MLRMAPPVRQLSESDSTRWKSDLSELARKSGIHGLEEHVRAIVEERFLSNRALQSFVSTYRFMPIHVLVSMAFVANDAIGESPVAAYFLALFALILLSEGFGTLKQAYMFHLSGWHEIPFACIEAALRVGAFWPARELVTFTYQMIDSTGLSHRMDVLDHLSRSRTLARAVETKLEFAVRNLADDLLDSCRETDGCRAELGAIAWLLGFVPESGVFNARRNNEYVPSLRFFRQLVRHSIGCLRNDVLLQSVWLELLGRGRLDLRAHDPMVTAMTVNYSRSPLNQFEAPEAFARTIIAYFRGDLGPERFQSFLDVWNTAIQFAPLLDATRFFAIVALVRDLSRPITKSDLTRWRWLFQEMISVRSRRHEGGEQELLSARENLSRFYLADTLLRGAAADELIDLDETYRSASLSFWVAIASPRLPAGLAVKLEPLLREEQDLITLLRGAYFEILWPGLPEHYHRYDVMLIEGKSSEDLPRPNPSTAPARYQELKQQLAEVRQRMTAVDETYASYRPESARGAPALAQLLRRHSSS